MDQIEINCPYCHEPGQTAVVLPEYHSLWTSCDLCLQRMHISGNFKHMSPDDIRKTVDGMSKLVALYVKGEAS